MRAEQGRLQSALFNNEIGQKADYLFYGIAI